MWIDRRTMLVSAGMGALLVAGCVPKGRARGLRIGDQKGGSRALLTASGALRGAEYEIEWSSFPAGAAVMEALNADAIDLGGAGDSAVIFALAGNTSLKIVSAMLGNPASAALVVMPGSPFHSVADLKGRKVGTVRGSNGHLLVLAALRATGLRRAAIDILFLNPADARSALQSGSLDAWATWDPFYAIAEKELGVRTVVSGQGLFRGYGFTLATERALSSKTKLILDYRARAEAACRWALAHPDAYASIFAIETGLPADIAQTYVRRINLRPAPLNAQLLTDERRTVSLLADAKVIPHSVDIAGAIAPGFMS